MRNMNDVFDYFVGYYVLQNDAEQIKAGFTNLKDAEDYLNHWDTLFKPVGFIYIDAPEGKYIYGESGWNSSRCKLFSPNEWENAYIYDAKKDENVRIDAFLPYTRYVSIKQQNSKQIN